jgi:hypothetical protein
MSKRLLILLVALVAACGGTAASTTTAGADEPTTTATTAATTTTTTEEETSNETVDLADMPQECIDAFVQFLQAIEPVVQDFDFQTATLDDMEAIGTELEAVSDEQMAEMESLNCPDVSATDEESFAAMIDIAEREAPGTVPYFRWIEEISASFGGEGGTGDCETDIEALEAVIADNDTMGDLTFGEVQQVGALMTSITTACSPERAAEFLAQPEVEEFLGSGG